MKRLITAENAHEFYKEYMADLDQTADLLSEAEKEEIRKDAEIDNNLYLTAVDWNITVIVLKQILKG